MKLARLFPLMMAATIAGLAWSAQADTNSELVKAFKSLENRGKGAFGPNILQGTQNRVGVLAGEPSGGVLFQAAYRNENAQALVDRFSFYVGNLFSTNYYQLMGEFVYGNPNSDHGLDHAALLAAGPAAAAKATTLVQHWVLEKHYVHQNPNTSLARGFKVRGIAGSEFEVEYARYFFNYYLSVAETDPQYLAASLLAKASPIADSASLERARNLIAALYDAYKLSWGETDERVRRLYQLRNAIHNQLSNSVPEQIDAFTRTYSEFRDDASLSEIRQIVVAYYAVSAKKVAEAAKKLGAPAIQSAAEMILAKGSSPAACLSLSNAVADLRTKILSNAISTEKKTDALLVLTTASTYLNKEMNVLKEVSTKEALKVVVNLIYIDGFLIKDNWQYFQGEIDGAASVKEAGAIIGDIVGIALDTLTQAVTPAIDQWLAIDPKMQYFIDNTLKSSSVTTASLLAEKIKR